MLAKLIFSFLLVVGAVLVSANGPNDRVELITKSNSYRATFTYTIEEFLRLPYAVKSDYFDSPTFSTNTEKGVQWFFRIWPYAANSPKYVAVALYLSALPSGVQSFSGSVENGLIDVNGQKQYVNKRTSSVVKLGSYPYNWPVKRRELELKANELLPGGKLTISSDVEGVLVYNANALQSEVVKEESKGCAQNYPSDTFNRLSLFDDKMGGDVELKSGNESFKCHKKVLSARSPYFGKLLAASGKNKVTYDLSDELTAVQLRELLRFMYRGESTATLHDNCRALFVIMEKYQFKCLKNYCEDILVKHVGRYNAREYLKIGDELKSDKIIQRAGYCIANPNNCY